MAATTETPSILQTTLDRVVDSVECRRVIDEIKRGARLISISGLVAGPAKALVLAALQRECGKQFAIVTQAQRDLESWERDLGFWYCALYGVAEYEGAIAVLPASETDPYAGISPHAQTLEKRALALWRLQRQSQDFVLLTARALARKSVAPSDIEQAGALLKRDADHSPEELVEKLIATGYMREDPVSGVGEFSIRGGILDVWPPGRVLPVRLEFFGDTIDSLREFDPETQLSTRQLDEVEVAPMRELAVTARDFRFWAEMARERWHEDRYARALRDRTAFADEGEPFAGWEWLMPIVRDCNSTIFEHMKDAVLIIDEPAGIETYLSDIYESLADSYREVETADDIALAPEEMYLTVEELREMIAKCQRVELRTLGRAAAEIDQGLALVAEA